MSNVPPLPSATNQPSTQPLNPYAVTTVELSPVAGSEAEVVRRHYIGHEASVKSIGTLHFLGSLLIGFLALFYGAGFIHSLVNELPDVAIPSFFLSVFCGCVATLQGFTAWGLWRRRPWARILAVLVSCFGLFVFPIGTLINGYFLYLLLSEKANVIFSDAYQEIVRQTPHVKYRTSTLAWIALGLFIVLIVVSITLAMLPAVI